jgi:hypothetical protein
MFGRPATPDVAETNQSPSVGDMMSRWPAGLFREGGADSISAAQGKEALRYASIDPAHSQREPETALPRRSILWSVGRHRHLGLR